MKSFFQSVFLSMFIISSAYTADISSYLYGDIKDSKSVKNSLTNNGFTVLGEYDAMSDAQYKIIVYTSPELTAGATKKDRAFAAVQKVMINQKDKTLVFTNPEYFLRAFMQDDYNSKIAKNVTQKISSLFGPLSQSKDTLEDDDIGGYHFMMSQPYYEDMEEVAEGSDLLDKLEKNAGDKIVFKLKVGTSTLVGLSMQNKVGEAYYLKEIAGQKHAVFLPYMLLIEAQKAKVLHPKYYLAISYPNLSMGEFMGISGTPDDILEYITKALQ